MSELLKAPHEAAVKDVRVVAYGRYGQIVLLEALRSGPKRGRVELPGGRTTSTDVNVEAAVHRTMQESTGLEVSLRDKEPVIYDNYRGEKAMAVLADIVMDKSVDVDVAWGKFKYDPAEHERIMQSTPEEALRNPWLHGDTSYVLEVLEQRAHNERLAMQAA